MGPENNEGLTMDEMLEQERAAIKALLAEIEEQTLGLKAYLEEVIRKEKENSILTDTI